MVSEKKDKLNEKKLDTESFKNELSYLRISIYSERIKKRTRRRLERMKKRLVERKKKEAFPRKGGKYNELFQDLSKESWTNDTKTTTK